jgi:F-type H+-transporting ATPase subunit a
MNDFNFLSIKTQWHLLSQFGIRHWFLTANVATIIATWAVFIFITITLLLCRFFFQRKHKVAIYLIGSLVNFFMDLTTQALGTFEYRHFSFVTALFIFILYCNVIGVFPFLEEPTADLNTTLALGIISFLYINFYSIKTHGIKGYLKEYFEPFFLMFPLHVVGKLASIISISFRLFGNLLGGSVITKILTSSVGSAPSHLLLYVVPIIGVPVSIGAYLFFGIFEGFIQAFVFAMLSLTYLSTEIAQED